MRFEYYRKQAIDLDKQEASCQVVACFIPYSMIWPDQLTRWLVFEVKECGWWKYGMNRHCLHLQLLKIISEENRLLPIVELNRCAVAIPSPVSSGYNTSLYKSNTFFSACWSREILIHHPLSNRQPVLADIKIKGGCMKGKLKDQMLMDLRWAVPSREHKRPTCGK